MLHEEFQAKVVQKYAFCLINFFDFETECLIPKPKNYCTDRVAKLAINS